MIINALVKRYEDTREVPPGWQQREVSYALDISEDGRLLGIVNIEAIDGKKTKKRSLMLPMEPSGRTSGIKAAFLCDNGGYLLAADEKRGNAKFMEAKQLHNQVLEKVDTPTACAIRAFFDIGVPEEWEQYLESEKAANAKFVFQVNGVFVDYLNDDLRDAWDAYYSSADVQDGKAIRCLVTGMVDEPEPIHGAIKLRGGQSSGSILVCANAESFTSYGRTVKDRAADIGKYAAFAYVTALRSLIGSEKHHQFIGKDTLVYWVEDGGGEEEKVFSWTSQPTEGDSEKLDALMKRVAVGLPVEAEGCKPESRFHLLCLSPNASRISVRFFHTDSFGSILKNNIDHYRRLEVYKAGKDKYKHLPIWMILNETTLKKQSTDVVPLMGGQFLQSVITGGRYPMTLYQAIINRIRAGEEINKTKAAIVKAVLMQNYNIESEVATVSLNPQTDNKPYVLGRLFSVLERLQQQASEGKLNTTIRDKYFSSACANPSSVFPTLLKLSTHHAAKLDNSVYFEILKTELLGKLDVENPFPTTLNLEDQGRFILGYYHQTQEFFTSKKYKEDLNNE